MKKLKGKVFPAQLFVLYAALLCLPPFNTAHAASGTCAARYEAVITHVDGEPVNKVIRFGEFQSYGQGRMPIRAAERAKRNAEQCMQDQWNGRENNMIPYECQDQQRIAGYYIHNFAETVQQAICRELDALPCDQGSAEVNYSIFAAVDGGPGCGTDMNPVSRILLAGGLIGQCQCQGDGQDRGWDRGRGDYRDERERENRPRRRFSAPQQISPAQDTMFYHIPRRTLLAWQPVPRARGYVVEVRYNGSLWNTFNTTEEATFITFDFPGAGQGEWRVMAQGRRDMKGPASLWSGFSFQR